MLIRCQRCTAGHPLGVFAVGERVVLRDATARADGLQPGTPGVVVAYSVMTGARHQEIRVEIRSKRKRAGVVAFAPCELAPAAAADAGSMADYRAMSREEFRAMLRGRRAVVHVLADADAAFAARSAGPTSARR